MARRKEERGLKKKPQVLLVTGKVLANTGMAKKSSKKVLRQGGGPEDGSNGGPARCK